MANPEHLAKIKKDVVAWNAWRESISDVRPDLSKANLSGADLHNASLSGANLSGVDLHDASLSGANLSGMNLNESRVGWTVFGDLDLSAVKNLESVRHEATSTIGVDTIYRSGGKNPGTRGLSWFRG
jgi:Pentapeptide repeats (8 copies)